MQHVTWDPPSVVIVCLSCGSARRRLGVLESGTSRNETPGTLLWCLMGVALLNTRAGDVVESGESRKIFPGKILWYTVVFVVLDNRVV